MFIVIMLKASSLQGSELVRFDFFIVLSVFFFFSFRRIKVQVQFVIKHTRMILTGWLNKK